MDSYYINEVKGQGECNTSEGMVCYILQSIV